MKQLRTHILRLTASLYGLIMVSSPIAIRAQTGNLFTSNKIMAARDNVGNSVKARLVIRYVVEKPGANPNLSQSK
jgi:hypothetical protein